MPAALARVSWVLLFLVLLAPGPGTTAPLQSQPTREELYRGWTIVTGQGEENRAAGFAKCLEDVLIKVSGDPRLGDDRGLAALTARAQDFVASFRYRDRMHGIPVHDEQGSRDRPYDLTVDFRPELVDAALRSLGREPWLAERPLVLVLVSVEIGDVRFLLQADGEHGRGQRDSLYAAAGRLGIPVMLPTRGQAAELGIGAAFLSGDDVLTGASGKLGADRTLAGSLIWREEAGGWIAQWRFGHTGQTARWTISGVSFDEAFRSALRGTAGILSGRGPPT